MPVKFAVVNGPVLNVWGIRFFSIKNYLVFCRMDEVAHTVHVVRFLYENETGNLFLEWTLGENAI